MYQRPLSLPLAIAAACSILLSFPSYADTAKPPTPNSQSYKGPPVMEPSQFFGTAAMGYASAQAAPSVMAKLFCYCGCDAAESHKRLIDCFTSNHGVDCHICQEEAIEANRLHRDGLKEADIQKAIDEKFAHNYPFTEESANFKEYKASRLYKVVGAGSAGSAATAGPEPWTPPTVTKGADKASTSAEKAAAGLKVKPGFKAGNCCSEEKHTK